jgi:hypothetical protein
VPVFLLLVPCGEESCLHFLHCRRSTALQLFDFGTQASHFHRSSGVKPLQRGNQLCLVPFGFHFLRVLRCLCFSLSIGCESLQVETGIILELSDRKARGFLVLNALKRLFFEYTHKLFGEMTVRTKTEF